MTDTPQEDRPSVELADPVIPAGGLTPEELQHEVEDEMRDEDA